MLLNDRLGSEVEVSLDVDVGEHNANVIVVSGELQHWRAQHAHQGTPDPREDIAGLYDVGGTSIDITDLEQAWRLAEKEQDYGIGFAVGDRAMLVIAWDASS
jgi:hypothetical protein